MDARPDLKREIWVVDHLDHWRTLAVEALRRAGLAIRDYREYSDLLAAPYGSVPRLVLLGCVSSRAEELELVQELVRRGWPVIVLSSSLTLPDLRQLFHAGAADVIERPHAPAQLLSIVRAGRIPASREPARLTV